MDTRNKIVTGDSAVEIACRVKQQGRKLVVVTGYFDVLQPTHVRDLAMAKRGAEGGALDAEGGILMVVLLPKVESLLSERARAELVAGLSMVDYVVIEGEVGVINRLPADEVISRQATDEEQTRLLTEHVLVRHK
jgi:glycerol-3-phosphate cytidylyltransferase-like family protein